MEEFKGFYRAFREYREKLETDETHRTVVRALQADAGGEEAFNGKLSRCVWDEEWMDAMLDALPSVERALDEQRRFIESNAEIRRIDQARRTSVESVRHLAQHSNLISNVQGEDIIPDRVLIVERDDSYAIYENRFLYTLVLRMQAFLEERWRAVEELNGAEAFSYDFARTAVWNRRHLEARLHLNFERRHERRGSDGEAAQMEPMEKLRHLRDRVENLTRAPLMRQLKGVTQVSPPIVRTNVFKKNDNFKRALELFEYLESYRKLGYEILVEAPKDCRMPAELRGDLCELVALEGFVGRMAASEGMRQALEANFQRENELAEQERIRREQERERRVQERIAAARAEEIEIRRIEVAKREAVIAEKNARISELERQCAEEQARARALADRNAELENRLGEAVSELAQTREARDALAHRLEEEQRRAEALDAELQQMQARFEAEAQALREQVEQARREGAEALERARMEAGQAQRLAEAQRQAERESAAMALEAQRLQAERDLQVQLKAAQEQAARERAALEAREQNRRRELQQKLERRATDRMRTQQAKDERRAAELERALEAARAQLERIDRRAARRAARGGALSGLFKRKK